MIRLFRRWRRRNAVTFLETRWHPAIGHFAVEVEYDPAEAAERILKESAK